MRPFLIPAFRRSRPNVPPLPREVYAETINRLAHLPPISDDRLALWCRQQLQNPSDPLPLYCIAQAAHEAGYEPYAQALRDLAIDCYPHGTAKAHYERGRQRIRRGEWGGWEETEWRWRDTEYLSHANRIGLAGIPRWDGEPFDGSVMVLHEGGFGDALMMYRYLPAVIARCQTVYVLVSPELRRLAERAYGKVGDRVRFVEPSDPWPTFDQMIPMMSLPAVLGKAGPDMQLVLAAAELQYESFAQGTTPPVTEAGWVGVVWCGRDVPDPKRSMPIECLAPLVDKGPLMSLLPVGAGEAYNIVRQGTIQGAMTFASLHWPVIKDFADTARLINHCIAVVTIDTAVAHLAGCLGVKTYLCLPYAGCWRWGMSTDSDWYPSVRIVRQERPGEWDSVIARVVESMR
jgi:hypothetical protein